MNRIHVLGISAVATVAALGFACGASSDADDDSGAGGESAELSEAARDAALSPASTGTAAADTASGSSSLYGGDGSAPALPSQIDRKIIFTAMVSLEAEDVAASFNAVARIATTYAGFVERSSMSGSADDEDNPPSGSVTIRVPAESYQQALADIRGLSGVEVKQESANSAEVTEEYTDLESRLRNLERTEQQYLELMAKATTIPDILSLTDRLDSVRLQIEQVQGRINYLDSLADLATIDVSIASIPPAAVAASDGQTSITEAFADAWEWSLDAARNIAVAAAYLLVAGAWLAIPAALVLFALRRYRRRAAHAG